MSGVRAWLDARHNRELLTRFRVQYKTPPRINGRLHIGLFADEWRGTIRLGENVTINSSLEANPVGGTCTCFVLKGADAVIELDDGAGVSNVVLGAMTRISIGKNVMLGAGTKIFDTDFHSVDYEERMADTHIPSAPVEIHDGAFIGGDVIILKGVTIGARSVIGAGSVVVKDVPPGEVWGGNPAKCLKKL